MHPSSAKMFLSLSIFFFFTPSLSTTPLFPPPNTNNITLSGDAFLNASSIILTTETNCTTPLPPLVPPPTTAVGRAFYVNPFPFRANNATASFSCSFSFTIAKKTNSCPSGDGFAFLITSNATSFSSCDGYMGLPDQDSYVAVEFDTSLNTNLEDINGDHVAVDLGSVRSLASVDLVSRGIDMKSGREMTAWIEYRDSEKTIRVWVGFSKEVRPLSPVLVSQVDLSKSLEEFMHVGFTAANGKGSSTYIIDRWRFKTYFGQLPSTMSMDIVEEGDCLMCPPKDPLTEIIDYQPAERKNILNLALMLVGFAVLVILIAALVVICVCLIRRRRRRTRLRAVQSERQMRRFQGGGRRLMAPEMLSLNEIKSATNGFNEEKIIGEGASAVVYEGSIPSCGSVAVKRFNHEGSRFDPSSTSRIPFNTEFATMMGCLRHKNLVQLQGWCCEKNELVLVYEYMANGSLDKILHNRTNLTKFLTWERRLNIIKGVASALIYLHEECESQIIHRDVKTCNILLDSEFNPKLGDFGLAEVYRHSLRTRYATVPAGTMGYLAPEYAFSGIPTVKTDVYSFGVVVLEVATGRRPVDERGLTVADYVWDLWERGVIIEGADGNLGGRFDRKEMVRVLMVGLLCAHPDCGKRPTVREAARMLRGEGEMPVLPTRKPTLRLQSVVPNEVCEEITSVGRDVVDDSGTTPWSTPRSHFSRI